MTTSADFLFKLLRIALGNDTDFSLPSYVDWSDVFTLASIQSVIAISADGLQKIYDLNSDLFFVLDTPELEDLKYSWLGAGVFAEQNYTSYTHSIFSLANFYEQFNIKMMVLKGYGLSLNYPIPSHRPVGDIDIFEFGRNRYADQITEKEFGVIIDRSHHHHTVFKYQGQIVENHYDFINVVAHKDAKFIEAKLKELVEESEKIEIDEAHIFLPSADFNAIFLIRHAGQHFAGERLTLRQLLDWGLFIDKHHKEVSWDWVLPFIKQMGCWKFFCALNAICIDMLGFDQSKFPQFDRNCKLEERVLNDIISPEFSEKGNCAFYKFCRWCTNIWKHQIVYNEKLVPMFITLAWSHIKRPV